MKRRLCIAALLTVFLLSCLAFGAAPAANAAAEPTVSVSSATAWGGDTVTVTVSITDNPGIMSAYLKIGYDSRLVLQKCENTGLWGSGDVYLASSSLSANPYYVSWDNSAAKANKTGNGALVRLTFSVKDGAVGTLPVTVGYTAGNVIDTDLNEVSLAVKNGGVTVPAPTLNVIDLTASGPRIKWDALSGAEAYRVYRKTAGGSWKALVTGYTDTAYTDTTAVSGTTYYYTVRAFKAGNARSSGYNTAGLSALWLAEPTLNSVANAASGVQVTWGKVTGASGYIVYRRTYAGGKWSGWSQIAKGTALSCTDKTAQNGVNYQYTVRAYRGSVKSTFTASATVRRLVNPVVTAANAAGGVKVSWNKNTGASGYIVYRRTYAGGKWSGWSQIAKGTALSCTDKTAQNGVNYQYTVRSYYGAVKSSFTASATVRRLVNPVVTAANAAGGVKVSWNKNTGASGYIVYRRTYAGGKWSGWSQIAKGTALSCTDKTAKSGTTYQYTVRSYYGSVKSAFTASASLKRLAQPTVKAAKVSNGIKASWNKITGASGYIVYRRTYSGGKWSGWSQVAKTTALSYTDKTAQKGVTYRYTVRAYSGSYKSSYVSSSSVKR